MRSKRPLAARLRRLGIAAGLALGAVLLLWLAIHRVPGLGPALADGARGVLGPGAVAALEDFAYDIDDRVRRAVQRNDKPKAYWEVPAPSAPAFGTASATAPAAEGAGAAAGAESAAGVASAGVAAGAAGATLTAAYRPGDLLPMNRGFSAPGDGVWLPIVDVRRPHEPTGLWKTLLHPDGQRSWSAVAVVAVDLGRVDLHLVAGKHEPENETKEARDYPRKPIIPAEHQPILLAAWNGGYKTVHGHYGMKIDGFVLSPPRGFACLIGMYEDGRLTIAPWESIAPEEPKLRWWRQTPKCMYHDGKAHAALGWAGDKWGAAPSGSTVIRRSAIGLSPDGAVLYVGMGDHVTGEAIAKAMNHAGADDVAQLDVNFSYPKFLMFEPRAQGSDELVAKPLTDDFEYTEDEYVRRPSSRDFFYVTRRPTPTG